MADDYCEMCDLPLSTCVHGMPTPAPAPPKAAARPRAAAPRRTAAPKVAAPPRPRRRTAPEDLAPVIVGILTDAGGQAEADDVLAEVAERYADRFLPGDHETGPQGELRWRTTARWARKALADDGLLVAPQPGVWALTDRGRRA